MFTTIRRVAGLGIAVVIAALVFAACLPPAPPDPGPPAASPPTSAPTTTTTTQAPKAVLQVSPSTVDFGTVPGATHPVAVITIKNVGNLAAGGAAGNVSFHSASHPESDAWFLALPQPGDCQVDTTLAPGESCSLPIRFAPPLGQSVSITDSTITVSTTGGVNGTAAAVAVVTPGTGIASCSASIDGSSHVVATATLVGTVTDLVWQLSVDGAAPTTFGPDPSASHDFGPTSPGLHLYMVNVTSASTGDEGTGALCADFG